MRYRTLTGEMSSAEPWSPGPVYQSIWALDDGRPVAILLKKNSKTKELEPVESAYLPPPPPAPFIPVAATNRASDVLHRWWLHEARYVPTQRRTDLTGVVKPTPAEVRAARVLLARRQEFEKSMKGYREAHSAPAALADKRLADLWKADHNDDFTEAD